MGKRDQQFEKELLVDCEACDGSISIGFFMGRGDVLSCKECGTGYLLKSRKPLRLVPLEEDYYDEDEETFDLDGYGDDGYGDGRDYE